ncbi:MAG: hypothetical protein IBX69_14900 [Anaerolineales bacterium]|nr:hypothetical protein [Anaerolineales bacterium]
MTLVHIIGLAFVIAFLILILVYSTGDRKIPIESFREIEPFKRLKKELGRAVETGSRLHLSMGRGSTLGTQSSIGFMSLSTLASISKITTPSDRPPIVSAGEGAWTILSQDTMRAVDEAIDIPFDPSRGRLTGLSPFPFAAGAADIALHEGVRTNVLVGNFGAELALITESGERVGSLNIGGTDSIPGQAIMFTAAQEPLIGEEVFAGGAYMGAGDTHVASLRAQDVIRWSVIVLVVVGAVLKLVGIL